jgi:23S rRNA (adenine-N6)-dimethyltransferase
VVANLPFNRTGALLRRFLQEPASPLLRLDLIVQWQVARARARASSGPPSDLVGISWGPWWRFERGQRFPASCFAPVPSVDAAALHVRRRVPPLLEPGAARSFERLVRAAFSSSNLGTGLARVAGRRRAAAACSASSADPGSPPSMVSPPAWVSLFEQLAR